METIEISKEEYEIFQRWQTAQKNKKPANGGWSYYVEGVNPFSAATRNSSAQNELYRTNPALGAKLAKEAGDLGAWRMFESKALEV